MQETEHIDVFGPRAFARSCAIVAHAYATHIKCEAAGGSLNLTRASQYYSFRTVWTSGEPAT